MAIYETECETCDLAQCTVPLFGGPELATGHAKLERKLKEAAASWEPWFKYDGSAEWRICIPEGYRWPKSLLEVAFKAVPTL